MSSEDEAYKFICLRLCFGGTIAVSAQSVGKDSSFGVHFRRMRRMFVRMCFIDVDFVFDSLYSGNQFCVRFAIQRQSILCSIRYTAAIDFVSVEVVDGAEP